jgi:preprotein translocase subunit YajC
VRTAVLAHFLAASTSPSPSASGGSSSGGGGGGFNPSLLIFIVVIAGMFWFMSRAQRKQRQRVADLQSRLMPGQEVMTGAGIYGRIIDTEGDRARIEVAPGVVLTVAKQAVAKAVEPAGSMPDAPPAESDESRQRTAAD